VLDDGVVYQTDLHRQPQLGHSAQVGGAATEPGTVARSSCPATVP
jgi:hypothetical protein